PAARPARPSFPTRRSSDLGVEETARSPAEDAEHEPPPDAVLPGPVRAEPGPEDHHPLEADVDDPRALAEHTAQAGEEDRDREAEDRKSTRLNSSHVKISYA